MKDAAKVQNPVFNSQFKQAHENWNYLKVTSTDATWSRAQHNPQVRAGDTGATSTLSANAFARWQN